jgi:hypothetical protein
MKAAILVSLCLIGLVLIGGCNESSIEQEYLDDRFGFALDPPTGWIDQHHLSSKAVQFTPDDPLDARFTISVPLMLSEGLALSVYADDIEEQYPELFDNYETTFRDWRSHPVHTAYEIHYVYTESGQEMNAKQVAIEQQRTVFLLTFTATKESYDRYLSIIETSIDSFRIT